MNYLQSFDVGTIKTEVAGSNTFGMRFHDNGVNANPLGQFLFEAFTPLTNRANLALPHNWNLMTGMKQWQVEQGTTIIRGKIAPQLNYGPNYVGGGEQMFVLEPWKHGSLK